MTIDVKRNGAVLVVYEAGGRPQPISSFDAEPSGTFPRTFLNQGQLREAYPAAEFRFVDRPANPAPPRPRGLDVALPQPPIKTQEDALIHFRRLLDRYQWCDAESKGKVKIQCEAVASLLIEIWPDIAEKLQELKDKSKSQEFTLE